jgi:aspartate 4-decarboxylase
LFALSEAERSFTDMEHFGGYTQAEGLKARFDQFIQDHAEIAGIEFLQKAVSYAEEQLGIASADLLLEFSDAIIGNHYPVPDRMLKHCENICAAYIRKEFGAGRPFDLFATEGGTAAMTYVLGFRFAFRRNTGQHHRRLFLLQVLRGHGLAPGRNRSL